MGKQRFPTERLPRPAGGHGPGFGGNSVDACEFGGPVLGLARLECAVTPFRGRADEEIRNGRVLGQQRTMHVSADDVVDARALGVVLAVACRCR